MTDNRETHRAWLALVAAVLDGECDARLHDLLCAQPMLAAEVAHHAAHQLVHSIEEGERAEMRADIERELIELAGDA